MTVKWLLYWQPNPGATINSQILTEVSQCVETVNATKGGRWKSSLTYYKPQPKDQTIPLTDCQRDLVGIALQEQPNKYYFIIRSQQIVLEADSTLQTIMEKLQSYRSRALVSFEGFQYHLGDFQLKVGKVVTAQADNLRGIVMEVEYLPISSIEKSRQIMEEFYDMWQEIVSKKSLPGHFMHIEANFADYGLADHYTSQHTVVQYSAVMNQLLANVRT